MGIRLNGAMVARIAEELEATAARALPDALTLVQRARAARASEPCAYCEYGDTSPAAIARHNWRASEFGERSYPRRADRGV